MKLVTAIIKPDKVEALRQALTSVDIQGLTIVEAKGYGDKKATLNCTEAQNMRYTFFLNQERKY
jgi:nitrogen regulatory protein PII